jgi:hypothetical protein
MLLRIVNAQTSLETTTLAKHSANAKTPTKSDVIREILKAQPGAAVKEIRVTLHERGVKASDALINKIKYGRHRTNGKKPRRRRKSHANGSKADAIRGMLDTMGKEARSRDVIAALAKRGMAVSSAQVSTLRKKAHRGRAVPALAAYAVSLDQLVAAKNLADRLGGIDVARHALASLAKLMDG